MVLPKEVKNIIEALESAGFEAYAVGGCVRDFVLSNVKGLSIEPSDWDITTNAKPEEIQKIFKKSVYENDFGTVAINTESKNETLKIIEITTYRIEENYTDKRHPDEVKFTTKLEDDLARRDFTINAIAYDGKKFIDFFDGQKDIKNKLIRTVGNPDKRFNEDALRLLRAIRFAVQLNFAIEPETAKAIKKNANDLVLPEVEEGFAVGQNKHHIYTVWEHNLLALDWAVKHNYKLENRLASLLHDVGKPKTKRGDGLDSTFYNHEVVGAKMTAKILERLKFPKKFIEKVVLLVRYHLFYYNVEEVSESSVRRLVKNVGPENMDDLLEVRIADRKGSGVPKAEPYKLRHLRA
ncbi:MAG: Poly(A) polymerase, partial [Candidatus Azambacteria bacterium GW2011_GWA2_42_62]